MRRDIMTAINIPASPTTVWEKLANLPGWAQWNPLAPRVTGQLQTGSRLHMRLILPGRRPRTVYPEVLRVLPAEELSWIIRLWAPGLLDCEHRLILEVPETGDLEATMLVQQVRLSGILLCLGWHRLRPALTEGFHQGNRALRDVCLAHP